MYSTMRLVARSPRPGRSGVDAARAVADLATAEVLVVLALEEASFSEVEAIELPRPLSESWCREERRVRGRSIRRSGSTSLGIIGESKFLSSSPRGGEIHLSLRLAEAKVSFEEANCLSIASKAKATRRQRESITSSKLVWERRGSDGGTKTRSEESPEAGVVGEWKVAPFCRSMFVLRVNPPAGLLRGFDMFAELCGVDGLCCRLFSLVSP